MNTIRGNEDAQSARVTTEDSLRGVCRQIGRRVLIASRRTATSLTNALRNMFYRILYGTGRVRSPRLFSVVAERWISSDVALPNLEPAAVPHENNVAEMDSGDYVSMQPSTSLTVEAPMSTALHIWSLETLTDLTDLSLSGPVVDAALSASIGTLSQLRSLHIENISGEFQDISALLDALPASLTEISFDHSVTHVDESLSWCLRLCCLKEMHLELRTVDSLNFSVLRFLMNVELSFVLLERIELVHPFVLSRLPNLVALYIDAGLMNFECIEQVKCLPQSLIILSMTVQSVDRHLFELVYQHCPQLRDFHLSVETFRYDSQT